jgi:hypothetical protein
VIDAFTFLNMFDRRLPTFTKQSCQDCNDQAHADVLCTFTTGYFTDQAGQDLTCPFQTESRTETRYDFPDSTRNTWQLGITGTDAADTSDSFTGSFRYGGSVLTDVSYTSKVSWFDDDSYEYPYCKVDFDYYTAFVLEDTRLTWHEGETVTACSPYEHATRNYEHCAANLPGFTTANLPDGPLSYSGSEVEGSNYILQMENGGSDWEYTGLTVKECPQHASLLSGYTGAGQID